MSVQCDDDDAVVKKFEHRLLLHSTGILFVDFVRPRYFLTCVIAPLCSLPSQEATKHKSCRSYKSLDFGNLNHTTFVKEAMRALLHIETVNVHYS